MPATPKIHIWQGLPRHADADAYVACGTTTAPPERILFPENIPAGQYPEDIGVTCLACLAKFRGY